MVMKVSNAPSGAAGRMTESDPPVRESCAMGRSGMASLDRLAGGAQGRAHDLDVGAAAAEIVAQRLANLLLGWMRVAQQQRFGGHDHAVETVAALRGLFPD